MTLKVVSDWKRGLLKIWVDWDADLQYKGIHFVFYVKYNILFSSMTEM